MQSAHAYVAAARAAGERRSVVAFPASRPEHRALAALDLASQVGYFLEDRGETRPVPIFGGFVAEDGTAGLVRVFWRLPGPPAFLAIRRRRNLRRYERLLRSWGMVTELHLDAPEPYVACSGPARLDA